MKAEELRIGNIVVFNNSEIGHVSGILKRQFSENEICINDRIDICYPESTIKPLELTLEILFKSNFRTIKENIYEWKWNKTTFRIERLANSYWLKSSAGTTESRPLKYVHELQNLFYCITGEELTLKL